MARLVAGGAARRAKVRWLGSRAGAVVVGGDEDNVESKSTSSDLATTNELELRRMDPAKSEEKRAAVSLHVALPQHVYRTCIRGKNIVCIAEC